ncbi:LPP20 family lipoprotein [Oceanospirillum beijerinckii]|uniref:LPP20 family lipoprotein n=1 Tax=Oceanospirillum beijerinckii TaxID=64976 RepID=UPI0003F7AFD5|nr:LPP20 family lipoprotein [Oceanospirillum beijerinckii]
MKKNLLPLTTLSLALVLSACGSSSKKDETTAETAEPALTPRDYPAWIDQPIVEDGIAESACVGSSGNMTLDKKRAIANSRAMIAQSIESRIKAMDKTYQRVTESEKAMTSGSTFESVSKQVTEQNLRGTKVLEGGYFKINDKNQYCVMVGYGQQQTKAIFDSAMAAAKVEMTPTSERAMYEEFRAYKAQQELEQSLQ